MKVRLVRKSFTLVELLIVITIIGVLASSMLSALYTTIEDAKEARTRVQIARIHSLIMEKWESYQTRALPINMLAFPRNVPTVGEPFSDANGNGVRENAESYDDNNGNNTFDGLSFASFRRLALLDLMRMELPDRITDLTFTPINPAIGLGAIWNRTSPPALWVAYRRLAKFGPYPRYNPPNSTWPQESLPLNNWTTQHQGSECLYLILAQTRDEDSSALDFLMPSEIGDTDGDGYNEILDGWGRPIEFVRWPAGFATQPGPDGAWGKVGVDDDMNGKIDDEFEAGFPATDDRSELMDRDRVQAPDPLNPFNAEPLGHAVFPLIFSAGRDGLYDIFTEMSDPQKIIRYATLSPVPCNPFALYELKTNVLIQVGTPADGNGNGVADFADNITNHSLSGTAQ